MGLLVILIIPILGDSVNLASRLEGQTKISGVDAIVGAEYFAPLELDLVRVMGKTNLERVSARLGDTDRVRSADFRALRESHQTMLARYRAQDWPGARPPPRANNRALGCAHGGGSRDRRLPRARGERFTKLTGWTRQQSRSVRRVESYRCINEIC